ncbi:MAG: SHOCT domain-containing protein [Patescibacteria group bacterium]|nr:SHOCT domain-containing protein [Patescibacteria group bacterium]MDE1945467.1 SHOCT domain-containing protein [Patescibacteria group bacterium]MDE2057780.1 SHOCT domain-containing protein [Patescibacteria group bacterium]
MYHYYGYGPGYGMYGDWGLFGIVWHVVGFLIAVAVILFLVRMVFGIGRRGRMHGRHPWWDHSSSALEILNERYAKGEIDKAEYEERKKTLLG